MHRGAINKQNLKLLAHKKNKKKYKKKIACSRKYIAIKQQLLNVSGERCEKLELGGLPTMGRKQQERG